jgi:tetratricopeptide (TPR) repeat protein
MRRTRPIAAIFVSSMLALGVSAGFAGVANGAADPAADRADEPAAQEITVTGEQDPEPRARPRTGSRIARGDPGLGFQAVATDTGVAGLLPGSGMDPFAGATRFTTETTCRGENVELSPEVACRLAEIQSLVTNGAMDEARTAIHRLLESEPITDEERYLTARIWYQVGQLAQDPVDREDALLTMLSTSSMPSDARASALRTLVAFSFREKDHEEAIGLLEQLVQIDPNDARSRANLAALYANGGRTGEAAGLMREAIALTESRGGVVPAEWRALGALERTEP